ncbi:ABC transporter permease subunit [Thermaerobacter sp. PB12/4term]|uniref:ABC transporter permease n=1 Tax=Thermaerobacter sp. PB12/4term TaxID=2293838 RepID=UPI000E327044|nr:ABC transporter permease subunit [Thermaerobacter sp. PB12/4term]QIA27691.1 ABC transporter permease subunit [Thermaerobacter sp. PB12/4term]
MPAKEAAWRVKEAAWREALRQKLGGLLAPTPLNPIIELEFRARMRRSRTVVLLVAYVAVVAAVFVLGVVLSGINRASGLHASPYEVSWLLFQAMMLAELVLTGAVAGASGAGAISGERERQTLDVLLTTRLPAWRIMTGKLVAAVALSLWLVVASFPVFLPLFRFNAVDPGTLLKVGAVFAASGLAWAALGLFFSTLFRRTIPAVIATYATASGWVILTLISRTLLNALRQGPPYGPLPPQPVGPLAVEVASPVLALLYAMRSPFLEAWNWIAGSIAVPPSPSPVAPLTPAHNRLTVAARVAAHLGADGYFWLYVAIALLVTFVLTAAATLLLNRRRAEG